MDMPLVARSIAILFLLVPTVAGQEPIPRPSPSPEAVLGFRMGADHKLARWQQVLDYYRLIDRLNDRVSLADLGPSTQGRPMIAAIISSEETIRDLEKYRALQRRLALPDEPASPETKDLDPVAASKTVVLITCTIHSSETASTLMSLELLHDLASNEDESTKEILDQTIVLLVPSVNPDGVDIVADWYERTIGKPWEGSGLPRLYHPYAGHDTNRDWFMLNLKETQNLTRFLYEEWYPTITWDVHQMGSTGPRLFVPPFFDPINPNLDPRMNQAIRMVGAHMSAELAVHGKRGVATQVMYDNWWNGGNRTVPQRHNMVGILTEAASVRLASPIFLSPSDLKGGGRGFDDHSPSVDFVDPWPGGWWRLRDIVEYELVCAKALLTLAARYKTWFQRNYTNMASAAVARGENEPPYGWVVPARQRDPGTAAELVRILSDTGIRTYRVREAFETGGRRIEEGSWFLPAAQPYRAHLKDMMERQSYPLRLGADGTPERPYDVAGWTLPLQMDVEAIELDHPLGKALSDLPLDRAKVPALPARPIPGPENADAYVLPMNSLADHVFLNRLQAAGVDLLQYTAPVRFGDLPGSLKFGPGTVKVPNTDRVRALYRETLDHPRLRPELVAVSGPEVSESPSNPRPLASPRIGLYQPWVPSMDEGWTRLVLEQYEFPYATLHDADIRAGALRDRFDTILLPSVNKSTLAQGYAQESTEPEYTGGLGAEGLEALRAFVSMGGTLVCLESSCLYAIEGMNLPVKNSLAELKPSQFYCPGSILRLEYPDAGKSTLISAGYQREGSAYFAGSLAFDVDDKEVEVVAQYARGQVLQSGWLLGEQHLAGKAALVVARYGSGRVVLFGFPPQHRGQTRGTYRLFFQALRPSA